LAGAERVDSASQEFVCPLFSIPSFLSFHLQWQASFSAWLYRTNLEVVKVLGDVQKHFHKDK